MKCIRTSGRPVRRGEDSSAAFGDRSRGAPRPRFRRPTRRPRSTCSGVAAPAAPPASPVRVSTAASGQRPGDELQRRRRSAGARGSRPPAASARTPRRRRARARCSVPSRWNRAGHALRAISSPTAAGQAATTSPIPPCGPKRPSSRRTSSPSGYRAPPRRHLEQLVGLGRQHRRVGRRDERLAAVRDDALGEDPAPGGVELREHVVEQEQRRDAAALRRCSSASASRSASTASRCSPCEPNCAARARRTRCTTSSRCGPSPVTPRSRSRSSRASSCVDGRRLAVVAQLAVVEPERRRALGERRVRAARASPCARRRARRRARRPAPSTARAPRATRARPRRGAATRCAARPPRRSRPAAARAPAKGGRARGRSTRGAPPARP